jgi:hypothetical protein
MIEPLIFMSIFLAATTFFLPEVSAAKGSVSFVDEHSQDIISAQQWMIRIGGSVIVTLAGFIWFKWLKEDKKFKGDLMSVLERIQEEQEQGNRAMNATMLRIEKELRTEINLLNRRVDKIETKCHVYHKDEE